ncbi:glycosyltransferase family 4 protein [Sphaerisporangium aureirubrum]|uniref:Glycosyltransferase family 4 protein n=1 Tax=Sphaerisporangium aureirubrum TaxID=1544736 RepID=A0ABW1NUD5_9ACTN
MRILRVSYRVPPEPGGKERHVECLTRQQVRRGHHVTLAFRRGLAVPDGAEVLPLRPTMLSPVLARKSDVLAFAAEVAGTLRRHPRPDLLHLHGDHVEASVLGPACRRLGVPLVLTVHAALSRRHPRFTRAALRHVGSYIALGTATAGDLMWAGADPDRIQVASSGLDLDAIARLAPYTAREPGLVVSVGSLEPMKNHALVAEAVRELRRTRPRVRLVVVGDGPDLDRLRRLAGPGTGVELAGRLSREQVYPLVRRAEAFVLASRRLPGKGEGVPTAALEALALGTPVVVSSDASLDPVVTGGAAYRVFRSGSLVDLVTVLGAVLDDPRARREMAEHGRAAAATLDWAAVAGRMEQSYDRALRTGRPREAAR